MLYILKTADTINRAQSFTLDTILIHQAQTAADCAQVRRLLETYAASFEVDLFALDGLAEELNNMLTYYRPPGVLLLAKQRHRTVGCVGLREIAPGVGEMKRLFVLPGHQGEGIGRALIRQLIEHAQERCFQTIQLEVLRSSESALSLYRQSGFREIPRYRNRSVSNLVAMELILD
ncbi:MAG: GNAT family N-acetyltransferase [Candidatus Competibacteraceae bacterium]